MTESKKLGQVTQFLPEIYKLLELLNTTSDIGTVNKTVSFLIYLVPFKWIIFLTHMTYNAPSYIGMYCKYLLINLEYFNASLFPCSSIPIWFVQTL